MLVTKNSIKIFIFYSDEVFLNNPDDLLLNIMLWTSTNIFK